MELNNRQKLKIFSFLEQFLKSKFIVEIIAKIKNIGSLQ
jgi:hypothetical protein